ncbi:MAG: nitrogen fixation protein NifQ, partial [Magnetospirillum sp.]|nr:nitrogen fixation protein NifQ [Magnetospirillum sp.]
VDSATIPGSDEARWLAAMVVRRSLKPDHLWQDLGLADRSDLSGLLLKHFHPLAVLNDRDMKWKKFFYRQLCLAEEVLVCKSPVCDACTDFAHCFGDEAGMSLLAGRG